MQRHRKKIQDLTLSYIDEGSGDAIVFIHGFCGSAAYWEEIVPSLTDSYRVIAPSLRGHGKTSAVCEPYTIDDMATDIKLLLDELNINKVMMFGHSLGGYVTLSFAEQYPEYLRGMSLIHSTANADNEEGKESRKKNIELICDNGIEPLISLLVPKLFSSVNYKTMSDEVDFVKEIGLSTSVIGAKGALQAMMNRPSRNHVLERIKIPVLLVAGEQDQIIPTEKVFSFDGPHIQQQMLKQSGHMGMLENKEDLLTYIKSFIINHTELLNK
ncbi:alpha/beta fold hydrolase [Bacillus salitolerans]|uniref:Alpha/beta fold hydrolase n=1 Tax=Bacillus salitolerans TaxID=1437434 RepID=A0ABW4LK42_9BACI